MLQRFVTALLMCDSWPQEELRNCSPAASGSSATPSLETPTVITPGKGLVTPADITFVNSASVLIGKPGLLGICLLVVLIVIVHGHSYSDSWHHS